MELAAAAAGLPDSDAVASILKGLKADGKIRHEASGDVEGTLGVQGLALALNRIAEYAAESDEARLACAAENLEKICALLRHAEAEGFWLVERETEVELEVEVEVGRAGEQGKEGSSAEALLIAAWRALGNVVACDDDDTNRVAAHELGVTEILCGQIQMVKESLGSAALRRILCGALGNLVCDNVMIRKAANAHGVAAGVAEIGLRCSGMEALEMGTVLFALGCLEDVRELSRVALKHRGDSLQILSETCEDAAMACLTDLSSLASLLDEDKDGDESSQRHGDDQAYALAILAKASSSEEGCFQLCTCQVHKTLISVAMGSNPGFVHTSLGALRNIAIACSAGSSPLSCAELATAGALQTCFLHARHQNDNLALQAVATLRQLAKHSTENGKRIAEHEGGALIRFLAVEAFRGDGMVQANKGQCECARLVANLVKEDLISSTGLKVATAVDLRKCIDTLKLIDDRTVQEEREAALNRLSENDSNKKR